MGRPDLAAEHFPPWRHHLAPGREAKVWPVWKPRGMGRVWRGLFLPGGCGDGGSGMILELASPIYLSHSGE